MSATEEFILQLAVQHSLLRREALEKADIASRAGKSGEAATVSRVSALIHTGDLDSRHLARLLSDHFGLPFVEHLPTRRPSLALIDRIPPELASLHRVFPLELEGGSLRVAVCDPLDSENLEALSKTVNLSLTLAIAPWDEVETALNEIYILNPESVKEDRSGYESGRSRIQPGNESPALGQQFSEQVDAPIVKLVWTIIDDAIQRGASDIHLEPMATRFRVRNRVDGVLHEVATMPSRQQAAIISRLKIMANLSIAERRLPQDGRVRFERGGKRIDLRVSSLPTAHGESVVMRILDKERLKFGLPELGFSDQDRRAWERIVGLPDGMVLVTGPTGSGKTTTLYSILQTLNRPQRKIVTVEDPVEYQLSGVNQVPVRADVGMTFANSLRAILRQSPNTVMVGEIRDRETAEVATNAALTGHLVFSTLHTNDACGAVTRLLDLGVKPFLVSSSLRAVLAQRLVRKICVACRKPRSPTSVELRSLGVHGEEATPFTVMEGTGCSICNETGFKGRVGIFELLIVNEDMQNAIHHQGGAETIRRLARSQGARTLRDDGIQKVISGITTLDEVLSITVNDNSASHSDSSS